MKHPNNTLLLRSLSDELTETEREELEALLREKSDAAREHRSLVQLETMLRTARHDSFGPAFADRVMERLDQKEVASPFSFGDALSFLFARIAPAATAVALALGVYNITEGSSTQSFLEAALGLQPVTAGAAYDTALSDLLPE